MKTLAIAVNHRLMREGLVPLLIIFTLLLVGATSVESKESIKFVHELKANLQMPVDVALAPNGDIYILDQKKHQVSVFNQEGEFMFNFGEYGSGWGKLMNPESLAISRDGDVIIADTGNKRVQVFNTHGRFVYELGNSGAKPGQFSEPTQVAIDEYGYIFVADISNKTISKFSPKGVFFDITPLDGRPADITFDVQQNMYILYPNLGKIVKRPMDGGYTETLEFNWEGRDYLANTTRMTVDWRGDLYLIDGLKDSIVKIDQQENLLLSFGSQGLGKGQFHKPVGIVSDLDGKIYVADSKNKRVQVIEVNGSQKSELVPVEGKAPIVDYSMSIAAEKSISDINYDKEYGLYALSEDTGHILHQKMNDLYVYGEFENNDLLMRAPKSMHILEDGKLLVADTGNNRLQFLNSDGSHDYFFGTRGMADGQFDSLSGVAVNDEGVIYVSDTKNNRIQIFNSDGIYLNSFGQMGEIDEDNNPPQMGYFHHPRTIEFDSNGQLYVLDSRNKRIQILTKDGEPVKEIGAIGDLVQFELPVDIAIDEWDNLYVADRGTHTIKVLDRTGDLVTEFGSSGKGRSYFPRLSSVTAADGKIYVADHNVDEIKVYEVLTPSHLASLKEEKETEEEMAMAEEIEMEEPMAKSEEKEGLKIKLSANSADAKESSIPEQLAKIEQPESLKNENTDLLKDSLDQDPARIYFTQISYPLKTENMDEKLKYQMVRKMTIQMAISNVATQYGIAIEDITPHVVVEKEDILDDGRMKITVSVPKNLSKKSGSSNMKVTQLK